MICRKCGAEVPDTAIYCFHCGAKLQGEEEEAKEPFEQAKQRQNGQTDNSKDTGQQKKNSPSRIIVLIAVIVVVVAAIVVALVVGRGEDNGDADEAIPAGYFDPFEGITLNYSGKDGEITAEFVFDNSYYDKSAYSTNSRTNNLHDGDSVTLYVADSAVKQTEDTEGLLPIATSKSFDVSADGLYIDNYSEITEEFIKECEEIGTEMIMQSAEEWKDKDNEKIENIECIGCYFAVNEDGKINLGNKNNDYKYTVLYVVYRVLETKGETNREYYTYVGFDNIMKYNDGTMTYDDFFEESNIYDFEHRGHDSVEEIYNYVVNGFVILGDTVSETSPAESSSSVETNNTGENNNSSSYGFGFGQ